MRHVACTFLLMLTVGLLLSCEDDCVCPVEPEPEEEKEYHFLYCHGGSQWTATVYTFSTKTGEIVDSSFYGRMPFFDAQISKDGKYVYYTGHGYAYAATWVTDYATGDTLHIAEGLFGVELALSRNDDYVLVSGGGAKCICSMRPV